MVRVKGIEPPRPKSLEPKSSASTSSATPARYKAYSPKVKPTLQKTKIKSIKLFIFFYVFFFKQEVAAKPLVRFWEYLQQ